MVKRVPNGFGYPRNSIATLTVQQCKKLSTVIKVFCSYIFVTPTSMTVPFVMTPRDVYMGDCGFFFTPIIDKQKVAFNCKQQNDRKIKGSYHTMLTQYYSFSSLQISQKMTFNALYRIQSIFLAPPFLFISQLLFLSRHAMPSIHLSNYSSKDFVYPYDKILHVLQLYESADSIL